MNRVRLTAKFHARWNEIAASDAWEAAERERIGRKSDEALAANRARALYFVAMRVLDRWTRAGFPSARLVDALPRPERGHAADWQGEGRYRKCGTCGRTNMRAQEPATCDGPSGYDLVFAALDAGIPFGVGPDGLPTAGVPVDHDKARVKLARVTCQPVRRRAA